MFKQSGFTLIELLIVVLIIGILAAIAIPVFNGQRTKAKNSVAQSTVRNAITAVRSIMVSNDDSTNGIVQTTVAPDKSKAITFEDTSLQAQPNTPVTSPGANANPKVVFVINGSGQTAGAAGAPPEINTTNQYSGVDPYGIIVCAVSQGDTTFCAKIAGDGKVTYRKAQEAYPTMRSGAFTEDGWK